MGNSLTGGVGGVEIPGLSASVPKQKGYVGRSGMLCGVEEQTLKKHYNSFAAYLLLILFV